MPTNFKHDYDFDPSYGYSQSQLLSLAAGEEPTDFKGFWQEKYQQALQVTPYLSLQDTGRVANHWRVFDCYYDSTDGERIGGWLLLPTTGQVNGAVVFGHGYGGIDQPDTSWNLNNTAMLFPCVRGISRSAREPYASDPYWHVRHNIQDKQQYVIGGCVSDLWCGVSALLSLFPQTRANIGFIGSSLGGGLGIFACAFDERVQRCHFHVPTFGNLALRMSLPSVGSTQSLRDFAPEHPELIAATLPYFDASCAARYLAQPTHWALAHFDPFVAPPGQFSCYNACQSAKQLYLLDAGHFVYVGQGKQRRQLQKELESFFRTLGTHHES